MCSRTSPSIGTMNGPSRFCGTVAKGRPRRGRFCLIVEPVILPGNAPSFGKFIDLVMLVMTGGQVRTEAEHRALLRAAGFELTRIIPTQSEISIVEGVPL
jgi:hypothetical protein